MDLNIDDLYNDTVWVDLDALLDSEQKKDLLNKAKDYCEGLGVDGIECSVEITTPVTFFQTKYDQYAKPKSSKLNRALVISADFDPYTVKGIISISTFAATTAMGVYKTVSGSGEKIFVINYSLEARRRTLIGLLKNIEAIDRFFTVDKCIDMTVEFLQTAVKHRVKKSLNSPN